MVPVAGSAYTYAYATLGELVAWIIGWDLLLEYAIGNTAVAISWAGYTDALLRGLGVDLPWWLVTDYRSAAQDGRAARQRAARRSACPSSSTRWPSFIVAVITIVLVWGVKESARFNAVMVGDQARGPRVLRLRQHQLRRGRRTGTPSRPTASRASAPGAAIIFFAYIGFDAVSTCAEECKNPGRDMPIGIIGSLVVCTVIYVDRRRASSRGSCPTPALVDAQRGAALRGARRRDDVRRTCPTGWSASSRSARSSRRRRCSWCSSSGQPRILFAMARDGFLPPVFTRVHPRFGTPHVSTILTGRARRRSCSAFVSIDEMVDLTNIGTLFAFILVCIGIIILRFREPGRARPFRVPFGPVLVPGLGILSCLFLIGYLPPTSWLRFVGWLLAGLVVYGLYGYRHSRLRHAVAADAQ